PRKVVGGQMDVAHAIRREGFLQVFFLRAVGQVAYEKTLRHLRSLSQTDGPENGRYSTRGIPFSRTGRERRNLKGALRPTARTMSSPPVCGRAGSTSNQGPNPTNT